MGAFLLFMKVRDKLRPQYNSRNCNIPKPRGFMSWKFLPLDFSLIDAELYYTGLTGDYKDIANYQRHEMAQGTKVLSNKYFTPSFHGVGSDVF